MNIYEKIEAKKRRTEDFIDSVNDIYETGTMNWQEISAELGISRDLLFYYRTTKKIPTERLNTLINKLGLK